MLDDQHNVQTDLFIGGENRDAENGRTYDLHNPARPDELVGRAAMASAQDVDAAVKAAHAAFPVWSQVSFAERADMLRAAAKALTGM